MNHSFDVNVAQVVGVEAAIILQHIAFWMIRNQANNKHMHDGQPWTYNSIKAFHNQFPYITEKKIRGLLTKCVDQGYMKRGNYNASTYDRTLWYSLTESGLNLLNIPFDKRANGFDIKANRSSQKGEPIPDINTDIKTPYNPPQAGDSQLALLDDANQSPVPTLADMVRELATTIGVRVVSPAAYTRKLKTRLKSYTFDQVKQAFLALSQSPFHMGEKSYDDSKPKKYASLNFLLRSDTQVEEWLAKYVPLQDELAEKFNVARQKYRLDTRESSLQIIDSLVFQISKMQQRDELYSDWELTYLPKLNSAPKDELLAFSRKQKETQWQR